MKKNKPFLSKYLNSGLFVLASALVLPGSFAVGSIVFGWTLGSSVALADDDDDDDGRGGDDDDDGGGGGGGGPGGGGGGGGGSDPGPGGEDPGLGNADNPNEDDGENFNPDDCFEEAILRPSWLRKCTRDVPRAGTGSASVGSGAQVGQGGSSGGSAEPAAFNPPDARQTVEPQNVIRGELVVSGASPAELAALQSRGFSVLSRTTRDGVEIVRLRMPGGMSSLEALALARDLAPGAIADFNHVYRPAQGPCTTAACRQRQAIRWPSQNCTVQASIGMIDTSVDLTNSALAGQDVELISSVSANRSPSTSSHGTAIAALLVGKPDASVPGLLPRAKLVAIQSFHKSAAGEDIADTFDIVSAIATAVARGLKVVNLSFTGPTNRVLFEAVKDAGSKGVVLVAAAGNLGPAGPVVYPAGYESVVAVTAVGDDLRIYRGANRGAYIDFAAPGVNVEVVAATVATRFESGTSFAAPFIAAALAAARTANSSKSVADLVSELQASATDLGKPGRDPIFGWGLVQLPVEICQ